MKGLQPDDAIVHSGSVQAFAQVQDDASTPVYNAQAGDDRPSSLSRTQYSEHDPTLHYQSLPESAATWLNLPLVQGNLLDGVDWIDSGADITASWESSFLHF